MRGIAVKKYAISLNLQYLIVSSRSNQFNLLFPHYFISSDEARYLAHNYSTQWLGDETNPVHVAGDMTRYLTTKAKDVGLGDFNRKDLIAATFTKKSGKGYFIYLFIYLFIYCLFCDCFLLKHRAIFN